MYPKTRPKHCRKATVEGLLVTTMLAIACGVLIAAAPSRLFIPTVAWCNPLLKRLPGQSPATSDPRQDTFYDKAGQHIRFEHFTIQDGLSQNTVYCIFQDRKGFLWFGTEDGLNRFDGHEFKVYRNDPDNPNSLSNAHVRAIHQDSAGYLWIGTYGGGLNRFDPVTEQFTHYRHDPDDPSSLSDDQILSVYVDRTDTLWVGTRNAGLDQFDPETEQFTHYQNVQADPESLSHNTVSAILQDSMGTLWVGTDNGLNRFVPAKGSRSASTQGYGGKFIRYQYNPVDVYSLRGYGVTTLYEDQPGVLWVGTELGVLNKFEQTGERFVHYQYSPAEPYSLGPGPILAILKDASGTVWVGTDGGGLNRLDRTEDKFTHYLHKPSDPDSLSLDQVSVLYQDRSGAMWIGTAGGGLNRYDWPQEQFQLYRADPNSLNSLSDNTVWAIHQDPTGIIWIGTDNGLNRLDRERGQWRRYQNNSADPHSLGQNIVTAVHRDPDGFIWVGTWGGGLDQYDPRTDQFTHHRFDPSDPYSLSNNTVRVIYQDSAGYLWIGTAYGLNKLDRKTGLFTRHDYDPQNPTSLSDNNIGSIYQDRSGTIWVGTHNGLNRFDQYSGQFIRYQNAPDDPYSLSHNIVFCIYEDQRGQLWLGTGGGGLNKFDRERGEFVHYRVKDGLPNDVIHGILEDDQGNLWLSTNNGLSRFDPRTETFKNYDAADGLQGAEFDYNAYFKGSSGEMFFGGVNGLNAFYPDQIEDNPYTPPVVLTLLTQGGEPVALERAVDHVNKVNFKWPNSFFEFEFAVLSYIQPEKNQYAYILDNFDRDWNYIGTRRFGKYTNLPGGDYTLRIKGANNDGVWNEQGVSIQVTIVPPFWATWWFRGLVALLVVGGTIGGYSLRVRSIEARSRELERVIEERTFEIEQRRRELEALYRADEELYRHLHLGQVLQALVDTAVDLLQADKGALMVWDEQREKLVIQAAHGLRPETIADVSIAPGEGVAGHVAVTGEPLIVQDACADDRVTRRITEPEGICSFMQVPIKIEGEVFGVFSADYVQPHTFTQDELRLLLSLAQRAAMAIENAQLYEQAQELVVVEERQRLARELHDSVTQALYGVTLYAEATARQLSSGKSELAADHLRELRETAQEALREMRLLIYELRPPALEQEGLVAALRSRLEAVEDRAGLHTIFQAEVLHRLPLVLEEGLYRIAQEALNNALKHAQAHNVTITLHQKQCTVVLEISDDGIGFDPSAVRDHGGLGLDSMTERAALLQAQLTVQSSPGAGTTVRVEVDL